MSAAPAASAGYVALVRAILARQGIALDAREGAYLARCEAAELSPRAVAAVIVKHARASRPAKSRGGPR